MNDLDENAAKKLVEACVSKNNASVKSFDSITLLDEKTCKYRIKVTLSGGSHGTFFVDNKRKVRH